MKVDTCQYPGQLLYVPDLLLAWTWTRWCDAFYVDVRAQKRWLAYRSDSDCNSDSSLHDFDCDSKWGVGFSEG